MNTRTTTAAAGLIAAGLLLAGCSSSTKSTPDEPGITTTTKAAAAAPATHADIDAPAILTRLKAVIPGIRQTARYTAITDPNGKLGRPHQYVSKLQFADPRVDKAKAKEEADGDPTDLAFGGTVEVFANDADAKSWVTYVDKIGQTVGGLITPDYLLRQDRYVIRASHLLTPTQADQYKAVLAKLS